MCVKMDPVLPVFFQSLTLLSRAVCVLDNSERNTHAWIVGKKRDFPSGNRNFPECFFQFFTLFFWSPQVNFLFATSQFPNFPTKFPRPVFGCHQYFSGSSGKFPIFLSSPVFFFSVCAILRKFMQNSGKYINFFYRKTGTRMLGSTMHAWSLYYILKR